MRLLDFEYDMRGIELGSFGYHIMRRCINRRSFYKVAEGKVKGIVSSYEVQFAAPQLARRHKDLPAELQYEPAVVSR